MGLLRIVLSKTLKLFQTVLLGYVGETAILIRKIRLEMKSHFLKVISFVSILLTT